jgi:predicted DNA-binding transcriptional regulator AlpA
MPGDQTLHLHHPAPTGTASPAATAHDTDIPSREPSASALVPLLVRAAAAARLCGVSRATWHRLAAAGRTPAPLRLGGSVLWRVEELTAWCHAGCPDRRTWEALRDAQQNGRRS